MCYTELNMETIINKLQDATDIDSLTKQIIAFDEHRKAFKSASLYQFGISPAGKSFLATPTGADHARLRENAILQQAEKYREDFSREETYKEALEKGMFFKERKQKIESALRLLIGLYKNSGDKLTPKAFILIARAYLLRSIIIRPKGMTVPEKKKECLKKGITFVEKALSASAILDSSDKEEAYRVQCLLLIELNKIDEKQCNETTLKGKLEEAITNGCDEFDKNEEDVRIALRYSEIKPVDTSYLSGIVKPSSKGTYLEKAKAFYLLGDRDNFKKCLYKAIRCLRWMKFSHPQWDEMVCFLIKMRDDKNPLWKEFSVKAWQSCQIQERGTPPINLRWHWSRQRDLYDLAFLSVYLKDIHTQQDYELMARICDSQKSRTSLRWSSIDDMAREAPNEEPSTNDLRAFLKSEKEAYALALMGGYVKGMMDISERMKALHARYREIFKKQRSQQREITDIPDGWIVIHFYLNKLEGWGYALIYNSDTKEWKIGDFSYQKLFEAFLAWQTNYNQLPAGYQYKKPSKFLIDLCKEIGISLPFLFDNTLVPEGSDANVKQVLFIPHDFLRRLPLHGAIQKGTGKVFLSAFQCCYLPAWAFAGKKTDTYTQGHILLKNFPEYHYKDLISNVTTKDPASADDLKNVTVNNNNIPPKLLIILCHGKADVVNPFNSRLKLAGNDMSHLGILQAEGLNIKGSKIILGACETDMVAPLSDIIDEHFSINTAFLTRKVTEILGTMWEALDRDISNLSIRIVQHLIDNGVKTQLWHWQKEGIRAYLAGDTAMFYSTVVFRVTGFCL